MSPLRDFLHLAVELFGRGLIEAHAAMDVEYADRFEKPQRAECVGIPVHSGVSKLTCM